MQGSTGKSGGLAHSTARFYLPLLIALAASSSVGAEPGTARISVSATILQRVSLRVLSAPQAVTITAADISRGYVDVPLPSQLAIRSNSPGGYLLVFENLSEFARQTLVQGLGSDVRFGRGGVVAQPAAGSGSAGSRLDLQFRFILSESARQGVHAWPLQVSVLPL